MIRKRNKLDYIAINQHRKPKVPFKTFGCFNANVCVFEGTAALCNWYKNKFNPSLTVKGIR